MTTEALGTLARSDKGPVAPAPALDGPLRAIVDVVSRWPEIDTTVHWHLVDRSRVDGVDFYRGDDELGHIHLDGSIHLATRPVLGERLIAEGAAQPFRWQAGWVEAHAARIGVDGAIDLFRRHYDDLAACRSEVAA